MNARRIFSQPGYILQTRPYRESSVILDVITPEYGLLSMLAKGARSSKAKLTGVLIPFAKLEFSFQNDSDLKLLLNAELSKAISLEGLRYYCGGYMNELLSCFVFRNDPCEEVYFLYETYLGLLKAGENIEQSLRLFELDLLSSVGFAPTLDVDGESGLAINEGEQYRFVTEQGVCQRTDGYITGKTLLKFNARQTLTDEQLKQTKKLMRHMIDVQLQGKSLKSRQVIAKVMKYYKDR